MKYDHDGAIVSGDTCKQGIASVGSDGFLQIYDPKEYELQAQHQISEWIQLDEKLKLDTKFNPSGTLLAFAGSKYLRMIRSPDWLEII